MSHVDRTLSLMGFAFVITIVAESEANSKTKHIDRKLVPKSQELKS